MMKPLVAPLRPTPAGIAVAHAAKVLDGQIETVPCATPREAMRHAPPVETDFWGSITYEYRGGQMSRVVVTRTEIVQ